MAITEVYVDPAINADSGTGTIGDPYGDLQYALNTVTRDATNGNRFNIKAGTAEVLGAALSLATYGTPTVTAPLVIQGYTSAAGDRGVGEIDGAASYSIYDNNNTSGIPIYFYDLKMGNCGSNIIVRNFHQASGASRTYFINCEIYGTTSSGVYTGENTWIINCHLHTISGQYAAFMQGGLGYGGNYRVISNHFNTACTTATITFTGHFGLLINNIIRLSVAGAKVLTITQASHTVINNTIYQSAAGTATLLPILTYPVINNVIVGASGTGGIGATVSASSGPYGNNAFYNCTTNVSGTPDYQIAADISLGASPFIDAANGNFEIDEDSAAREAAYPAEWHGLATTISAADIGAVQAGAGAGGGMGGIFGSIVR